MKKTTVVIVALLTLFATAGISKTVQAQEAVAPVVQEVQPIKVIIVEAEMPKFQNRVSFNALGMLLGFGNITYERGFGKRWGLEASLGGMYFGFGDDSIYGMNFGVAGVFYFTGHAPRGLRLSLGFAPGFVGASNFDSVFLFNVKAMFGYNWIWRNGFSIGLNGGVQYSYFDIPGLNSILSGVWPALDFNLGYAF